MRGLLGKKLGHSFSKMIHEKLDGIKYDLIEVEDLDSFFQENAISALNVTIPYKNDVIKYLDEIDGIAEEIQIVNTIVNKNGKLVGCNTDYMGLGYLLEYYGINIKDKCIGILGNGSTMRTVKLYVENHLANDVYIFARNPKENEYSFDNLALLKEVDILINATPNGMYPHNDEPLLVPLKEMKQLSSVVDLIYNPLRTNLLLEAEKLNIKAVNGLMMLVSQAVYANQLFNNTTYSNEIIDTLYKEILFNKMNIVVIGFPMSGKSFISKKIAKKYHKEYVDLDSVIEQEAGLSIPDIFEIEGESGFRKREKEMVFKYSKLLNKAISPGGGVVLDKDNMNALKQNGVLIFLDVPLKDLENRNSKNRPLLKNKKSIAKLFDERYNLYNTYCDIRIVKVGFNESKTLNDIEVRLDEYINSKWS
jgi:shikimate dehydrogenase